LAEYRGAIVDEITKIERSEEDVHYMEQLYFLLVMFWPHILIIQFWDLNMQLKMGLLTHW